MGKYKFRTFTSSKGDIKNAIFGKEENKVERINQDKKYSDWKNYGVVADGISHCPAGMQAAYYTIQGINLQLPFLIKSLYRKKIKEEEILDNIGDVITSVNDLMYAVSEQHKEYGGWGSTLDCCLVYNDTAYFGHVGDGEIYYLNRKTSTMRKITTDHIISPIGIDEVVDKHKTVVMFNAKIDNHMGLEDIYVEKGKKEMNEGDVILLASDGLTKIVSPTNLKRLLLCSEDPDELKEVLSNRMNEISDYTEQYAAYKNITPERAAKKLIDDTSFVVIMRTK